MALLLTAALVLVVAVTVLDEDLSSYITLMSAAVTSILVLGRVRSRSKLIYVGIATAIIAMLTEIGDSTLAGQPLKQTLTVDVPPVGWWAVAAGFLMTGLLPFIEKSFGVLTDISLLEIGDISHPLLQELVRRAPGTYNHSINVAAIGEAAADAIGARGLLVRVGAYFHDIGKMLKPQYFAENQGQGVAEFARNVAAGHEPADHRGPRERRCRPGAAASYAAADYRLHRAASRHDTGRISFIAARRSAAKAIRIKAKSKNIRTATRAQDRKARRRAC